VGGGGSDRVITLLDQIELTVQHCRCFNIYSNKPRKESKSAMFVESRYFRCVQFTFFRFRRNATSLFKREELSN
jgi:hypothetical protein